MIRVSVITQNDKFFIPKNIKLLIDDSKIKVCSIYLVNAKGSISNKKYFFLKNFLSAGSIILSLEYIKNSIFDKLDSIVLLQIDESQTHEQIKFESPIPPGNRSGLFPHYYGDLDIKSISRIWHLNRSAFEIPIEVMLQAEDNSNS